MQALKKASEIPGSWRPQVWLARHYLEARQIDAAIGLYKAVLNNGGYGGDALMMISGDLGKNGYVDYIPPLIARAYAPERDDPRIGLNLLQAYLTLESLEEGKTLLAHLYKLEIPPFKEHLDRFANEFQQRDAQKEVPRRVDDSTELEIQTTALEWPVWYYGLRNPD